jgi:excinuclease ABC subunit B
VVELQPSYEEFAYRIEFFGDDITNIDAINPLTGEILASHEQIFIYPAVHYVMPEDRLASAIAALRAELEMQVMHLRGQGKLLEAQRLMARTKYDLEMMLEVGYCSGIENYSRHLDGRQPGDKPYTLIDYFPEDFLVIIDESHVTIPQIRAMYNGDRQRKEVLVDHGFRLPSAMDNRPLKFEEFEKTLSQTIFVSATPGKYELERTEGEIIEQVIRPTGLIDPVIEVHPAQGQVPHLLKQIGERVATGARVLVTTLTKRLAEDLSAYIQEAGFRGRYLHSEIQTIERVEILRELREGAYDVLVGVNLLREGLDLPEVSMVAILDADKAGFLRSETSLIQMIGRAARNVDAKVVLYADTVTPAMQRAMDESDRRRSLQMKYNTEHGITPATVQRAIRGGIESEVKARRTVQEAIRASDNQLDNTEITRLLEEEMLEAAKNLEFERAAQLRDKLNEMKGVPTIKSGNAWNPDGEDPEHKIWQPKSKGRGKKRVAK